MRYLLRSGLVVLIFAAACGQPSDTPTHASAPILTPNPTPWDLPIMLPAGGRETERFNPVPGTPSFHLQARVPGGAEAAGEFFRGELRRLGLHETAAPNPSQARNLVVRLAAESQKARVVIMIVRHPIEKGCDVDIRWEEPPI